MAGQRGRGLIIAAPSSGAGKTLLTAGLLRCLRDHGLRVAAAKAGPDYIDPTFHAAATDRPCLNLDVWAMRRGTLAGLVRTLEESAEIIVCEGVMGLFDGAGPDGELGSTAALARLTGWPVVLVVDARRQGASVAALVAGFARHDPALQLAGVIFNRVASVAHGELLHAAVRRHLPALPCFGIVPREAELALPEQHLGLVPANEHNRADSVIRRIAALLESYCDIDCLIELAVPAQLTTEAQIAPLLPLGSRIAIACDAAFAFVYPATLDSWRRQGAELSFFSPLADAPPDTNSDAVYLPGGYPELHAGRLASAERFRSGLHRAAAAGAAIYGECGGYMVLGETIADADGAVHRMTGLLPLQTSFAQRRLHLGYRDATLLEDGPLGAAGARFRGHEFHYATIVSEGGAPPLFALADSSENDLGRAGLRRGTVFGSFMHLIDRR